MNQIFNHLWQSTLFVGAVALSCLALRANSPRLRYWLWLSASLKFLIPFSLFVSAGARVQFPPDTPSLRAVTVQQISGYFAPLSFETVPQPAAASLIWPRLFACVWFAGAMFLLLRWVRRAWALAQAARHSVTLPLSIPVPAVSSPTMMEPGVLGLFHPVIVLPKGIETRLTPKQFEAILAHELHHVRYRDNLTAALHMCVEVLFWFHPAVWWIGANLIRERETDCDEAVLRYGSARGDYARGIVRVCETYLESPLPCAPGIGGADLRKRIRQIMTGQGSAPMTLFAKTAFAAVALIALSMPFVLGVVRAQTLPPPPAYTYEVVSIHKSAPGQMDVHIGPGPQGGYRTQNTSVATLLRAAYRVQDYQIVGAPAWASNERFDVTFTPDKTEAGLTPGMAPKEIAAYLSRNGQRLQAVLRDRFGLVLRADTRELPIYGLVVAANGHKLKSTADPESGFPSIQTNGNSQITAQNATMFMLAEQLSMQLRRPVHDETSLGGRYDLKLEWTPDAALESDPASAANPSAGPSVFTAITEQLGLKLEPKKGPVPVYVVEKVERPTEN